MRTAIAIDSTSKTPLHRQIYESWRRGILRGRFAGGSRLPSTRELAATLQVSRSTVTQAYEQLIAEGYLQTAHGSGTFVCRVLPEKLLNAAPVSAPRANEISTVRLSSYGARLQHDFSYPAAKSGFINFSQGIPDLSRFPFEIWRRLYLRHMRAAAPGMFDYAERPQGYRPLCREIASYVARSRAVACTPEQVIIVNGSQQGLDLCARLLLDPGDELAIENPSYQGAGRVFAACGVKLRSVNVDEEGIICSQLGKNGKAAYVTPSHQFPTGVALSLRRRLELIAWARLHRAIIIEDDYDSEYRYSGAPLPALQGIASDVPVIYCGTFSKVMFPGLRIGYLVVPRSLVDTFARAKWVMDRHTSTLEQAVLADFIGEGHLERHIRHARRLYGERRAALIEALQRHFGEKATVLGEAAGMHSLVRIADDHVAARAARNKVQIRSVAGYYAGKAPTDQYLFGFSSLSARAIREGIKRLAG